VLAAGALPAVEPPTRQHSALPHAKWPDGPSVPQASLRRAPPGARRRRCAARWRPARVRRRRAALERAERGWFGEELHLPRLPADHLARGGARGRLERGAPVRRGRRARRPAALAQLLLARPRPARPPALSCRGRLGRGLGQLGGPVEHRGALIRSLTSGAGLRPMLRAPWVLGRSWFLHR